MYGDTALKFERNNNWEVMEEFCEMIGHRDDIWYATNIEIVDYNEAFDSFRYSPIMNISITKCLFCLGCC